MSGLGRGFPALYDRGMILDALIVYYDETGDDGVALNLISNKNTTYGAFAFSVVHYYCSIKLVVCQIY